MSSRSLRSRAAAASVPQSTPSNAISRPRRSTGGVPPSPSITVSRSPPDSPEDTKRSIRLTVKMPSSKLREVTRGAEKRHYNIFTEPIIVSGPRNSRTKKKMVEIDTDEDEDDLDSVEEEEGEEEANQSEDAERDGSDDDDGEGELDSDADADGDIDMDDAPPLPITITAEMNTKVKNTERTTVVEDDDDDDDEELSELESDADADAEGEEVEKEEIAPAEEVAEDEEMEEEEEEEELDSDNSTPVSASRATTPDISRMTKRQRGRISLGEDFLQLPMEPQVKKHLTAEEHAMRRAEMARRRKNLSEKRNEEEKMDTINKLLKKQAPKRRGKISAAEAAGDATPGLQEQQEPEKPDPTMIRYISNREGCIVGVPDEWLGNPAGSVFGTASGPSQLRRLVEEV
ncbi:hypothetical protein AJ80_02468 [Polytolypa hystricis UAMH7299]|uniref:INO80 complex subunit B-like conserved region domain-containing protein n=1 Tax=Polytolypa hystricis (strain UAMH7299) TaxID=1447883 RepID=A0A2B7YHF7_POLH7|nr:hypothetical protein AJ80_02468 [Polytolypa hystricis UAMH7299]